MIKTIADQYLAQNAGRRYPFRDDTELPDWLTDAGVLDFRCTLYGVGAGTAPEARLVSVAHTGDGNAVFAVDLSAGGVVVDTIRFTVPANIAGVPYTAYASGARSTGALTVTGAAIWKNPYDSDVEYIETDGVASYINTGITPVLATYRVSTKFQVLSVSYPALTSLLGNNIFGAASGASPINQRMSFVAQPEKSVFRVQTPSNSSAPYPAYDNNVHEVSYGSSGLVFDGVSYAVTASTSTCGPICLGTRGAYPAQLNPQNFYTQTRFYDFKIYDGDNLVFDGIPVRFTNELGQSEGAMYDRVSGALFRNAGTGVFGYGDDVYVPPQGEYHVDIPFAATTVVCDSLKVMSLQSGHDPADARDKDDPSGLNAAAALSGEIVLAEGRNTEPYLDGNHVRLDIFKGAGLGENCQSVSSAQTCDNVLFTINGERPGSDGDIRIVGEDGITVTPDPGAHALTVKMDTVARDRMTTECASECSGG